MRPSAESRPVVKVQQGARSEPALDELAAEEPLEIRLNGRAVVVTMRTPGDEEDLALGFLLNGGILGAPRDATGMAVLANPLDVARGNIVNVRASRTAHAPGARTFHATSACGICGQASLDTIDREFETVEGGMRLEERVLVSMPQRMRDAQSIFDRTGGLHAAVAFDAQGRILALREDIGRHNAVDKVVGALARAGQWPLSDVALLVSGRAGFEVVQKAVAARVPIVAAVGAPSGLAARLAERSGVTLVGFLRGESFNIYSHPERVV